MKRIAIIGGGISGLCAAYALQKQGIAYDLFEASDRLGGYILSKEVYPDALFELGPNTILADSFTLNFFKELGLSPIFSNPENSKNRFIARKQGIMKLPSSPPALLLSSYFSLSTKLRVLQELFTKPYAIDERESLADTFTRHFGREVVELALRPFVQGIYGAPPELLLTSLCFPSLVEMVAKYGSLLKGFAKNAKLAEKKQSVSFNNGLQELVTTLEARLSDIHLNTALSEVELLPSNKVRLHFSSNSSLPLVYDGVVVATDLKAASKFLSFPSFRSLADRVPFISAVSIQSVWSKASFSLASFNGFGCLHSREANLRCAGNIYVSSVFPSRSADNLVLLNSIVLNTESDSIASLEEVAVAEIKRLYNSNASPLAVNSQNWPSAFPLYGLELQRVWQEVQQFPKEIVVIGNWYRGISLNDLIRKGLSIGF